MFFFTNSQKEIFASLFARFSPQGLKSLNFLEQEKRLQTILFIEKESLLTEQL